MRKMIDCVSMGRKLNHLLNASMRPENEAVRMPQDKDLAKAISTTQSTITKWRSGRDLSAPNRVSHEHLLKLCKKYIEVSGREITSAQAYYLWKEASSYEFERWLSSSIEKTLLEALQSKEASIDFRVHSPSEADSFELVADETDPEDGEVHFYLGDHIYLEITTSPRKRLIVLGQTTRGSMLMVPSKDHNGRTMANFERLPKADFWKLDVVGPAQIIVIELPIDYPLIERQRGDSLNLTQLQEETLISELEERPESEGWRWGRVRLYVHSLQEMTE